MSINKIILVGYVGKAPDVRTVDNGIKVANFTLATTEKGYTSSSGTQVPDRTEWHNIVCWKGLAGIVEKYLEKGSQVYIEGKIRSRSYDDKNGVKKYIYEVYADNIELLGTRTQSNQREAKQPPIDSKTGLPDYAASNEEDLPF